MIRNLPISFSVLSLLCTLPGSAFAQATTGSSPTTGTAGMTPAPASTVAPPPPATTTTSTSTTTTLPAAAEPTSPPLFAPPPVEPSQGSVNVAPAPMLTPMPPPPPAAPSGTTLVELKSLRLLRDSGVISKAEFDSAMRDMGDTSGVHMGDGTVVLGKWATTLYGFVDADSMYDTTRSFNDLAGAGQVAGPASGAGSNSRVTFGVRNSRLGFRIKAPEVSGVRASGVVETDFLGTQLPIATGPYPNTFNGLPSPYGSEGSFFTSPTMRVRHSYLKVETPIVDILFGQYWSLFGFGPAYQPNTVQIQGVPGEIYVRTPQFRLSKTIKMDPVSLEVAVAAMRPAQRDSGTPDGQAGIRFNVDSWTGQQTVGATGTQISPMSIAVSGLVRHVAVNAFNVPATNTNTSDLTMGAIAVDAYVPVIPAKKEQKDNALSVQGEFASGYGFADQYTGLTGGIGFPSPTTGAYSPDIDPGLVTVDGKGGLHGVQWTTYLFGAQYYLPGTDGKLWISGNYTHTESANSHYYTFGAANAAKIRAAEDWFDVNAFVDPAPGARFGVGYANFNDMTVNGIHAINHRFQLSGYFIF